MLYHHHNHHNHPAGTINYLRSLHLLRSNNQHTQLGNRQKEMVWSGLVWSGLVWCLQEHFSFTKTIIFPSSGFVLSFNWRISDSSKQAPYWITIIWDLGFDQISSCCCCLINQNLTIFTNLVVPGIPGIYWMGREILKYWSPCLVGAWLPLQEGRRIMKSTTEAQVCWCCVDVAWCPEWRWWNITHLAPRCTWTGMFWTVNLLQPPTQLVRHKTDISLSVCQKALNDATCGLVRGVRPNVSVLLDHSGWVSVCLLQCKFHCSFYLSSVLASEKVGWPGVLVITPPPLLPLHQADRSTSVLGLFPHPEPAVRGAIIFWSFPT